MCSKGKRSTSGTRVSRESSTRSWSDTRQESRTSEKQIVFFKQRKRSLIDMSLAISVRCKLYSIRSDRIKHVMSIESKRIDLILDEFDQPAIVEPQSRNIISQRRPKSELVNDYVDLYKNFNEFNARYNPRRAEEIKVC